MDMPCACRCGTVFDINDGNPCYKCNTTFCTDCAEHDSDLGWVCERCKGVPEDVDEITCVGHPDFGRKSFYLSKEASMQPAAGHVSVWRTDVGPMVAEINFAFNKPITKVRLLQVAALLTHVAETMDD